MAPKKDKAARNKKSTVEKPGTIPPAHSGNFEVDFLDVCREKGIRYIPPVIPRPKPPYLQKQAVEEPVPPPSATPKRGGKAEESKKKHAAADAHKHHAAHAESEITDADSERHKHPSSALTDAVASSTNESSDKPLSPEPTTFTLKPSEEFFKPSIQLDAESPEKPDTVVAIYIRGWRVDMHYYQVFDVCWPYMESLMSLNLWKVGMTKEVMVYLASFLPRCPHLKSLTLDYNPVPEQCFHVLIEGKSRLKHLSLRYCDIDSRGACLLSEALLNVEDPRYKPDLASLTLNGNEIGDDGLEHLVKALRRNRVLVSLSVASNRITDKGASTLASVLCPYPLTKEELVERRKMLVMIEEYRIQTSKPVEVHLELQQQASLMSTGSKSKSVSKVGEKLFGKDDKSKKSKGKEDGKGSDPKQRRRSEDRGKMKEDKDGAKKDKGKPKSALKKSPVTPKEERPQEVVIEEVPIITAEPCPVPDFVKYGSGLQLLDEPSVEDGQTMFPANRFLVNLNLSNNQIGEPGLQAFLNALQHQVSMATTWSQHQDAGKGLMRLCLDRNLVSRDHYVLRQIKDIMLTRDPLYTPENANP